MAALKADLIVHNGKVAAVDADDNFFEALAVCDGRITTLGTNAEVLHHRGPDTELVDLAGRTAIPGIIDSHCHPDGRAARVARWHELSPDKVGSRSELLACLKRACANAPKGEWVPGYRFNENRSGGYPSMAELDAACPDHPVFILRTDGHLGLANANAFAACDLLDDEPDPPFGRFDRHPDSGEFTGLVRETAAHIFLDRIHATDTPEIVAEGLVHVCNEFLSYGVTTIYNSLAGSTGIRAYQRLREAGQLPMRIGLIISGREDGLVESYIRAGIRSGFGDDWIRVIGVEWCPDCSTSGRTAAYYEPYQGTAIDGEPPGNTGMLLYEADDLASRATQAHGAGLQVMIEGVGDRGIDFAIDALESALKAHPKHDHRMRVEHCCHVTPAVRKRLADLGIVDSSATGFMYELGDAYVANRGSDAMRWMWPHRTLIDEGIPAPGHSDAWVCSPNPFTAMWSMVNRKTDRGTSLDAREAVSPTEALRAYTTLGAFSGREEQHKGSLEIGKLADIAVLDRDLFSIAHDDIREIKVDVTIVGGEVKYRR
ncbi:MAG: amidohydrolase [Gammaproteobacteria bacterium]|nr:amidohydrolase [Gammaproteobacteria bacterium]